MVSNNSISTHESITQETTHAQANETHGVHVELAPNVITTFGSIAITNTYLSSLVVLVCFGVLVIKFSQNVFSTSSLHVMLRFVLKNLNENFSPLLGEKTKRYLPVLSLFFFFILLNNWFGLLPFVGSLVVNSSHGTYPLLKGATADLNTTLALALFAVLYIQYESLKALGIKDYLKKYFNFSSPINVFIGFLEILEDISKVLSFAFRLFGNIFAGEVMLAVIAFLIPILATFPFFVLEVFVGFVQAFVFSMLMGVFLINATQKHH